jgi:hypothetical protein
MPLRPLHALAPLALLCGMLTTSLAQPRPETTGAFKDRNGTEHRWTITRTNALVWEGKTYAPVGGTFTPRSMTADATETSWELDAQALKQIRAKGVADILIKPTLSAAQIPPAVWQKLIDLLEDNGFRYGIGFGEGINSPLTGTVVKPSSYRIPRVTPEAELTWTVSDADSARVFVVDSKDGTAIHAEGRIRVSNGIATTTSDSRTPEGAVALLYPRKTLFPTPESALPDVWQGFDAYRDRLLRVLSQVRFGPGLRFFLDPLGAPLGLFGEAEYLIPDSPAFLLEWEAYLTRRYPTMDDLLNAWGLVDRDLKDFDFRQAARLIPLWANHSGLPFLYDLAAGRRHQIAGSGSRFWSDFHSFRNTSLAYYMNTMADLLKREVANVPVVYTRTQHHPIFTNPGRTGGFDGLGIAAYARGSALVTSGADSVFSQALDSGRSLWLVVTEMLDTTAPDPNRPGYASRDALFFDLDWLRGIGAKGFFLNGFQVLPERRIRQTQLLRVPEQVGWLKEYADRLDQSLDLAMRQPRTLPYPANAAGLVQSGPIGNGGVWMIPSLAPGRPLEFGNSYAGYTISLPEGDVTVLWSLRGPRETRLYAINPSAIQATTADGRPIPVKADQKRRTATLLMDDKPVILRTGGQEIVPIEAVEDALKQLRLLLAQGAAQKANLQDIRYQVERVDAKYRQRDMVIAYIMAQQAMAAIVETLQPYTWLEAEQAQVNTFSEVTANEAASGGMFLQLNTANRPPRDGYSMQISFSVPADDTYTVWIACTPPGGQASPFAWIVNTGEAQTSSNGEMVGVPYMADRFGWMRLGRVALKKGNNTFTLRVTDRAPGLDRYHLEIDALLITRGNFNPSGTARPIPIEITDR